MGTYLYYFFSIVKKKKKYKKKEERRRKKKEEERRNIRITPYSVIRLRALLSEKVGKIYLSQWGKIWWGMKLD